MTSGVRHIPTRVSADLDDLVLASSVPAERLLSGLRYTGRPDPLKR